MDSPLPRTDICVIFSTPTLSHSFSAEFKRSWTETIWACASRQIAVGVNDMGGDPYLAKVRSKLATAWLRDYPIATDFFFLDDDIGWPAQKVIEFLERPEPVLAGIYPLKSDDINFPVELKADVTTGKLIERDGLVAALSVPTGFLRFKRHVIERIAKISAPFKDQSPDGTPTEHLEMFRMGRAADSWWWGEDYYFSRAWVDGLDGELWVDPNIPFTHRGSKAWKGNLSDHLEKYRERAAEAVAKRDAITRSDAA